jgi:hypothetical protein
MHLQSGTAGKEHLRNTLGQLQPLPGSQLLPNC